VAGARAPAAVLPTRAEGPEISRTSRTVPGPAGRSPLGARPSRGV